MNGRAFIAAIIVIVTASITFYTFVKGERRHAEEKRAEAIAKAVHIVKAQTRKLNRQQKENQLAACERGNPLREVVSLAVKTAASFSTSPQAQPEYAAAWAKLLAVPYANPDGTIRCKEAIKKTPDP